MKLTPLHLANPLSGYYIAIDHMNGWLSSLYVHLDDDVIGDDNAGGKSAAAFAKDFKRGDRLCQTRVK